MEYEWMDFDFSTVRKNISSLEWVRVENSMNCVKKLIFFPAVMNERTSSCDRRWVNRVEKHIISLTTRFFFVCYTCVIETYLRRKGSNSLGIGRLILAIVCSPNTKKNRYTRIVHTYLHFELTHFFLNSIYCPIGTVYFRAWYCETQRLSAYTTISVNKNSIKWIANNFISWPLAVGQIVKSLVDLFFILILKSGKYFESFQRKWMKINWFRPFHTLFPKKKIAFHNAVDQRYDTFCTLHTVCVCADKHSTFKIL